MSKPKFKFKCPKGNHKGWHYLPVTFTGPPDEDGEQTVYYTVVECYGTGGKRSKRGGGYCKPFMIHESENDLYRALAMMIKDIDRYRCTAIEENPWNDEEFFKCQVAIERLDAARKVSQWHCDLALDPNVKMIPGVLSDRMLRRIIGDAADGDEEETKPGTGEGSKRQADAPPRPDEERVL